MKQSSRTNLLRRGDLVLLAEFQEPEFARKPYAEMEGPSIHIRAAAPFFPRSRRMRQPGVHAFQVVHSPVVRKYHGAKPYSARL